MISKGVWALLLFPLMIAGCGRASSEVAPVQEPEPEPLSVTQWTDRTELFAEYPPLVVGHTSRFAIHLTRLDSFKALLEGRVEVRLSGGGGPAETFAADGPSRPGIFGVDVKPGHGGARELAIVLKGRDIEDTHQVGAVTVYADKESALAAPPPAESPVETISFLKEQQWSLDFGTALVSRSAIRDSVRVPAVIAARPGGAADVVAPIDGRLVRVIEALPGASVSQGHELARVQPPAAMPAELPQLLQAQAEARSALQFATRDRERAERLVAAGAAPQKRLDEAKALEEQSHARLAGANARLAQYQAARTAGAAASGDSLFVVRSPITGVIAERTATTGANVAEGTVLFRIVDAARVQVVGQVPEVNVEQAKRARNAELEVPGQASRVPAGPLSSLGRVLDPRTRTVPIAFAFDNRAAGLAVGQSVFLHLLMDETASSPVVPASAIVDDGGRPIVFVQREGESFERRAVTLGRRSGDVVQVVEGVQPGERIVSAGAHLVRLASLSTQVPSHGHVH